PQRSPTSLRRVEPCAGGGFSVTKPQQARPAIEQALKIRNRPIVLDCSIPTEENVYPMIPSGQSIDEMRIRENLEALKASVHADSEAWSFSDEDRVLAQYAEVAETVKAQ